MLYLITNRRQTEHHTLFQIIEEAVKGGVNAVILREKDLEAEQLLFMAKTIKEILHRTSTLFIINGNLEVAKEIEADGYHMGMKEFIEKKPDWGGILGVSVHSVEEAVLAQSYGADYVLAGHVFETDCKKGLRPRGTSFIRNIADQVNIPVIAIGGIQPENVEEVLTMGAKGAAVMSSVMKAENPLELIKIYKDRIKKVHMQRL